jgi:ribosome-associated protein
MSEDFLVIELNQQPVELCKLLKIADLVSGGGEAKVVISEGDVLLNGEVEYQKRKKVYHQDVIEFNGEVVQLIINESLTEQGVSSAPSEAITDTAELEHKAKDKPASENKSNIPKKRRPISF